MTDSMTSNPGPAMSAPAETELRAYAAGHRDGVECGRESAGFGFVECEHVGRFAAEPSRLERAAKAYLDAHECPGECRERDAPAAALVAPR